MQTYSYSDKNIIVDDIYSTRLRLAKRIIDSKQSVKSKLYSYLMDAKLGRLYV